MTSLYLIGLLAAADTAISILDLILVVLILVVLNGFFTAAEFSLLGARASRMEQLAAEGNRRAGLVLALLQSPDLINRYLAAAQLGITLVTLGLAIYAEPKMSLLIEPLLVRWFNLESETLLHTLGYILSIGLLTYVHVVLGEMVPKSLALSDANALALDLVRPMRWLETLLVWPIRLLNGVGLLLLRLFHIPPTSSRTRLFSPEEIEEIVTESTEGGLLSENAQEMIQNIFDFSERQVGQVMTPRRKVEAIPLDMEYEALSDFIVASPHSRFPVYVGDLDHVVGILHVKDFISQYVTGEHKSLGDLVRPAPVIPEDQRVEQLLAAFKRRRIHMAIVLDEFGGTAGVVTLEDLVEEVVGEVRDEFDVEPEPYVEIAPGLLEVAGDYLLDDLKDDVYLGEEDDLPDVETIGGLIVTALGRPAEPGDVVPLGQGGLLHVLAVDGLAVSRVRVEFPSPQQPHAGEESAESRPADHDKPT